LFEANSLTGENYWSTPDFPQLAQGFLSFGTEAVLIKGGHSKSILCTDFLLDSGGSGSFFEHERIPNGTQVRGTGCRLASSIAYYLGDGQTVADAVKSGIDYLQNYIVEKVG
jgi:hydroxymethylpyrimidine/phosphomethylpyrimidine kinase